MSPRKARKYHIGDAEGMITASELKKMSPEIQTDVMEDWFYEHFQDPVDCCPYDGAEGGYQFLRGGPYIPEEELQNEFEGIVPDEVIDKLANKLWNISAEWEGQDKPEDFDLGDTADYYFASLALSKGTLGEFNSSIFDIRELMKLAAQQRLTRMLYVSVITSLEAYLGDFFSSAIANDEELRRRFVETNPDFQQQKFPLSKIFEVQKGLENQVKQYLVDVVWHHLARVMSMFRDVLGIEFPNDMGELFNAVLIRHDIVHRNGKKKDGTEHNLKPSDIEALIVIVEKLVKHIEGQRDKIAPSAV